METSVSPWFLAITALSEVVEPAINNEYAFLTISATVYEPVRDPFNFNQLDVVGPPPDMPIQSHPTRRLMLHLSVLILPATT